MSLPCFSRHYCCIWELSLTACFYFSCFSGFFGAVRPPAFLIFERAEAIMKTNTNGSHSDCNLEIIIDKYYNSIWTFSLFLTDNSRDAAEEITQNVFLCLIEKWDQLEKRNIGGWLFGTTRRKYYEYIKAKQKEGKILLNSLDSHKSLFQEKIENASFYDEYFYADDDAIEEAKNQIINSLTEEERTLFNRYFERKMTYKEIMEELGFSYNSVKMKIHRLRCKIKKSVKTANLPFFIVLLIM